MSESKRRMSFKNEQGNTMYFLLLYYGFLELGSIWETAGRERESLFQERSMPGADMALRKGDS